MKKLSESFIDDVIRRSRNMEDREEDDVNRLDKDEFGKYLEQRYEKLYLYDVDNYGSKRLSVPIIIVGGNDTACYVISMMYDDNGLPKTIEITSLIFEKYPEIKNKLSEIAKIESGEHYHIGSPDYKIYLFQKDGKISNKFYVNVLDCILDNTDKPAMKKRDDVNESFIDDVIRRSRNIEDREEDNIELLDRDGFCEYLQRLYTVTETNKSIDNVTGSIQVPITKSIYIDILYSNPDKVKGIFITFGRMNLPEELVNILQTKYKASDPLSKTITIFSDTYIPNKTCIEIIDLILEYVPKAFLKKNVSESFIDDVIRRSRNMEEREEDNPELIDIEDFGDYLKTLYTFDPKDFKFKDFVHQFNNELVINLAMGYFLSVEYVNGVIIFSHFGNRLFIDTNAPKLIDTLEKEYELGESVIGNSVIIKSSINKKDIIKIIDIMIDCAKNNISVHRK